MHPFRIFVMMFMLLIYTHAEANSTLAEIPNIKTLLRQKIKQIQFFAAKPHMIQAVHEQNSLKISMDEIRKRDQQWITSKKLTPFKRSLQESEAGKCVKYIVEKSGGNFNEAFLTDNQGANVAAYPATSDYWQGDEKKWQQSFNNGQGKIFIGPLEFDESTWVKAIQVSVPVKDNDTVIGVLIVGVTLDYLSSLNINLPSK